MPIPAPNLILIKLVWKKCLPFLLLAAMIAWGAMENLYAQPQSSRNLSEIKIDELTDDQIRNLIKEAEKSGFSEQELEMAARARGMKANEIAKLRERVNRLSSQTQGSALETENTSILLKADTDEDISLAKIKEETKAEKESTIRERIFGYSLFNTQNLTFEPSLNLPTPKNYQLGPGDEIVVDIWGASQQTYNLPINREGFVNISNVGPILVNGLTVEQASQKIIGRLTSIYSGLGAPGSRNANTFAQISLGRIRSIKVTLVGEVFKPGTYTITSLATVFNALYVSGGPSENGSFRNIEVWRDDKKISTLDVYDFMVRGEKVNNIRLQDQDIIRIPTYQRRVSINGEIKRPGIFEVKKGEALDDLLEFAGGFTDQAYTHRVKIRRNTDRERKILDLLMEDAREFSFENGDVITVQPILDRFENRVEISGAVYREGEFELSEGLTLKGLIAKADGIRGDAYMHRASIYRTREDFSIEVIPFDPSKILNGEAADVKLVREDLIRIPSIYDLKDQYYITINGEVHRPGDFPFMENLSIEDLIVQAGGLKESASLARVEVARRIKDADKGLTSAKIALIHQFDISKNLDFNGKDGNIILEPFDQVYIRRSPGYEIQANVKVEGEVFYPGQYTIESKDEKISSLLMRAGGITPDAYVKGATLIRTYAETGPVDIRLRDILDKKNHKGDLILQPGDILSIPKRLETVKVKGSVLYARSIRYDERKGFRSYISEVGGYTKEADKKRVYAVYPNGSVSRTRNYVLFKNYPEIEPGTQVIVPEKPERRGLSAQETISIGSGIATLGLLIVSILRFF